MLDKLRKKLTLLCTLITAAILILIALIAFYFSAKGLNQRSRFDLMNQLTSVTQHLQSEDYISQSWLAQQEANGHSVISFYSQKGSLLFPGIADSNRDALISKARSLGHSEHGFNAFSSYNNQNNYVLFAFQTSSGHFLAAMTSVIYQHHLYELLIIKDMTQDNGEITQLKCIFIGLVLFGILLLCLFSWWFAGNAIQPIKISHQEQTDFVAAASHELRSPVAVIQAVTEEMLEDEKSPHKESLHTVHQECSHLSRLISDLLFLARADSGKWSIHKQPVEPDTLLLNIYDRFLPLIEANKQNLDIELPEEVSEPVLLDQQRIEQVLAILIHNAMAYTPAGTQILLSLEVSAEELILSVSDNGPGIADEDKPKVFKRFYRLDPSRKSDSHYGIGLSIASEILKLHHGQLTLTDSPHGGCTFKLIFPLS